MTVPGGLLREQELLLLALRSAQDPAVQARITELLAAGLDWTALVRTAVGHRLVPLLDARLQALGEAHVPADILHALTLHSARNREQNRRLVQAVAVIAAAVHDHELPALFVHGPALAVAAFGDPDLQEAANPVVLLRPGTCGGSATSWPRAVIDSAGSAISSNRCPLGGSRTRCRLQRPNSTGA